MSKQSAKSSQHNTQPKPNRQSSRGQPSQPQQSKRITPEGGWFLMIGLFLIAIAAIIFAKSTLQSSQSPLTIVLTIAFGAVGVAFTFIQILREFVPIPPLRLPAWLTGNSKLVRGINRSIPVIGIIGITVVLIFPFPPPPPPPPPPHLTPTPAPTLTPTPTPRTGKPTDGSAPFAVYPNYDPSGYVGDTGDISVAKEPGLVRFTYTEKGQGPQEWDWKYIDGRLNPAPCKCAGVLYLDPPNNFGTDSLGGFDLRGRHVLTWTARSLSGPVNVEFVIGGITWQWDKKTHVKIGVPYPDSMPRTSFGIQPLTQNWQTFQYDLSKVPKDDLRAVVAGFGWVINWDSNGVQFTGSGQPKTFSIEIKDIAYE